MITVELADVIKKILYVDLPPISDVGLSDIDNYTENGIQEYLKDLKPNDKVKLARIQLAMAIIEMSQSENNHESDEIQYKCVVCENIVNNHGVCKSNIADMSIGYGSIHDGDVVSITLCDSCLSAKKEKGIIQIVDV